MKKNVYLFAILLSIAVLSSCEPQAREEHLNRDRELEAPPSTEAVKADDLPIQRVVLYQNGIGYFERRGKVKSSSITLSVRPKQINDILKSLTVLDLTHGGQATSIFLPVEKSTADQLNDLPEQIQDSGGLLDLLRTFRGAHVDVKTQSQVYQGRIVGLERIEVKDSWSWILSLQCTDHRIQVIEVQDIQSINIQDKTLDIGLTKSLNASLNRGSWKPIDLTIRLDGSEQRELSMSYIIAMPIWKPAYRLVLDDEKQGLFQGWAIVDNVSGSDWNDVQLSLITGSPISFTYDLYTPHFVDRPNLDQRLPETAMRPPEMESMNAVEFQADLTAPSPTGYAPERAKQYKKRAVRGGVPSSPMPLAEAEKAPQPLELQNFEMDDAQQAQGESLSALFEYKIQKPVTIPDRSSAMVPLIQHKGEAREVAVFQTSWNDVVGMHPYRAVEFKNQTGFDLEPGPITLYQKGTFMGEGFLERTVRGKTALISFAKDPQITLTSTSAQSYAFNRLLKIQQGYLITQEEKVLTLSYTLENHTGHEITALIQRPKRIGWTVHSEGQKIVESDHGYYWYVDLPASKDKVKVKILEKIPVQQQYYFDSMATLDVLEMAIQQDTLSQTLKDQIKEIVKIRKEILEIEQKMAQIDKETQKLSIESQDITDRVAKLKGIQGTDAQKLRKDDLNRLREIQKELQKNTLNRAELEKQKTLKQQQLEKLYSTLSL